jgi:transporter family protein
MSYTFLAVFSIVMWGVASFFYKIANTNISPILVALVASPIYIIIDVSALLIKKPPMQLTTTGVGFALLGGLFMGTGTLAFGFLCQRGDAGEVTSITALYPAVTLLCSYFFLKEDLSPKKIIGIVFALLSVYLLSKK